MNDAIAANPVDHSSPSGLDAFELIVTTRLGEPVLRTLGPIEFLDLSSPDASDSSRLMNFWVCDRAFRLREQPGTPLVCVMEECRARTWSSCYGSLFDFRSSPAEPADLGNTLLRALGSLIAASRR